MSVDFDGGYMQRAALVIMHYQVDVFAILFGENRRRCWTNAMHCSESGVSRAGRYFCRTFFWERTTSVPRRITV